MDLQARQASYSFLPGVLFSMSAAHSPTPHPPFLPETLVQRQHSRGGGKAAALIRWVLVMAEAKSCAASMQGAYAWPIRSVQSVSQSHAACFMLPQLTPNLMLAAGLQG